MQIRICWCTIKVQTNTCVNFKKFKKIIFTFFKVLLCSRFLRKTTILWTLDTRFNNQCQTVRGQQLIFLKVKSESVWKQVCKYVGFGFVKKWQNPSDSKSVTSLMITHLQYLLVLLLQYACNLLLQWHWESHFFVIKIYLSLTFSPTFDN